MGFQLLYLYLTLAFSKVTVQVTDVWKEFDIVHQIVLHLDQSIIKIDL